MMTVMSLNPSPGPGISPLAIYGQSIPVNIAMLEKATEKSVPIVKATSAPRKKDARNLGLVTSGKAVFVADVASGGVLYSKAPHDVLPIASITKIMTALVVAESDAGQDGELTFQESDFDHEGKPYFLVGDSISRKDAMRALMVGSVNASANALARTSGMTREVFVERMNRKAKEYRLPSMRFTDVSGLDTGNKASAADVAALLTIALREPEIRDILNDQNVTIKTRAGKTYEIATTNLLLDSFLNKEPYRIIGAKTGSLPAVGYNLAQVTRDAQGREVVVVLLGSDNHFSRYRDVKALTAWAFDSYIWPN